MRITVILVALYAIAFPYSAGAQILPGALGFAAGHSADFLRGQQDRQRYEIWYHSLSGDFLQGAAFWAANRSAIPAPDCSNSNIPGVTQDWIDGCQADQQSLAPSDLLRRASFYYRQGWNSIPSDSLDHDQGLPLSSVSPPIPVNPASDALPSSQPDNTDKTVSANEESSKNPVTGSSGQSASAVDAAAPTQPDSAQPKTNRSENSAPNNQSGLSGLIFLAIVAVVIICVFWIIPLYNRLVTLRQRANRAFANMDVFLKKRRDLVSNIVETVRGYTTHEGETLGNVISLRSMAAKGENIEEKLAAENSISSALGKVFALAEAYPNLKADTSFLNQQKILTGIESQLSSIRMTYNEVVSIYNTEIQKFPAVLLAGILGFRSRSFFELGADARSELNGGASVDALTERRRT